MSKLWQRRKAILAWVNIVPWCAIPLRADEPKADPYNPMPWHLVDIWWDIGQDTPFESYSRDLRSDLNV